MKTRARYALAGVVLFGCGGAASSDHLDHERIAAASSSIIAGQPSTSSDDFVVFVGSKTRAEVEGVTASTSCGGTLVAPNLVLTAKHCVYLYESETLSICDASGEPQLGSKGGYATGRFPSGDIEIFTGVDAIASFRNKLPPAAISTRIIDDETPTFCSHDLAYVVLDRPITNVPLAKLRLGRRPQEGPTQTLWLAGWGDMTHRERTLLRMRRNGIHVQRVGPPAPTLGATGSLGPRTFETGPGGANGDSGGPAVDEEAGSVLGVLARALNADFADPISPYSGAQVVNVYMAVTDFRAPLRTAFAAAGAEPWLEGHDAPGFLRFGEPCIADIECEGNVCAGATRNGGGTCNVDCTVSGQACPAGFACEASRCTARPSPATPAGEGTLSDGTSPDFHAGGGCSVGPRGRYFGANTLTLAACALLVRRIRMRPRSRRGSASSK